jgi:hypothetical protein
LVLDVQDAGSCILVECDDEGIGDPIRAAAPTTKNE